MNYGKILSWTNVVLCLSAALGYAVIGDTRKAMYFLFCGCINATVIY